MDKKRSWHEEKGFISHPQKQQRTRHHDYTVAWICALYLEMAAAIAMLDENHTPLPSYDEDPNCYTLGRIKGHNVVIACLPEGEYGTNNAANVMTNLNRTFPMIRVCLMVGIGGGAPCLVDIRLGDVVVGSRVMQYDLGKVIRDGDLQRTAIFKTPPLLLRTAVTALRARHDGGKSSIPAILKDRFVEKSDYHRPDSPDHLFSSAYDHVSPAPNCNECESCDQSRLVPRSIRKTDDPQIHYGAMASGNQVMRSASQRDSIARELDVMCFEMEAAGLMGNFPCLPIRGICDYADSHKRKTWQKYAAATAAAYATELLAVFPGAHSHTEDSYHPDDGHKSSSDHRKKLLESLMFDQLDSRQTSIKAAHSKTCRWFLKSPDYNEWLKPEMLAEHHGLLWIRGKPGAGKSTLMKYLYTSTSRTRGGQTLITCFFFNARGEHLERSLEGMHRSLLLQLLRGYPELQSVLDDLVVQDEGDCPSLDTLKDLFRKAVLQLGRRHLICFIDALDECDEQQVMDMVDYFEDLTAEATDARIELRICLSSRHYPYVHTERGIKITLEDQNGHTEDLSNYVTSRLRIQNRELQEELIKKASGVFLWVVLVVDLLNKEYARGGMALRKRLAEMPSGLHELFKDMLRRDNTDRDQLLLCVLWILCAKRPLRPEEFRHAMWSDPSLRGLIDDELPEVGTSDAGDGMEVCVIGTSKGLAEITKTSRPTVQFIHESVRDFLLKAGGLQELWPGLGFDWRIPSHEKLKTCCHAYLSHPLVNEPAKQLVSEGNALSTAGISANFPFLEYASQHMLHHADIAAEGIAQYDFLSGLSVPDWTHVANHFEKHRSRRYTPDVNLLYILSDRGYPKLIRNWLQHHSPDIFQPKERYERPLFAALAHGHKDSVASLLGLDSTILDGEDVTDGLGLQGAFSRYKKRTPLAWAAQEGRLGMVKILLQRGADVSQRDKDGRTALSRASEYGRKIVELLLQKGTDLNPAGYWRAPLSWAAERGDEATASLLIDKGAIVDPIDSDTDELLLYASGKGHTQVVRFLLSKGADPNAKNDISESALMLASRKGHMEIAQLLLENGADIDATNDTGWTSLFYATISEQKHMVELLVQTGANVNLKCRRGSNVGQTPLSYSVRFNIEPIARILIQNGANIEDCLIAHSETRQTALSKVLTYSHPATAVLLVEKGLEIDKIPENRLQLLFEAIRLENETAFRRLFKSDQDTDARDGNGSTLLLTAIRYGKEKSVRLLLENGADIELQSPQKVSPLFEAIVWGCEQIVRLLVENGANVNFRNNGGETPLSRALDMGHEAIARYLHQQGARHPGREVFSG
ncbi:ankyrin [Colletotrichum zoysiae]|uniref:Ankyrin n=1 Tax=Colletotrichum zoysiae TaxID=1216348 RepID=A0AAD9HI52_9PEZI|nr:ankyrin [Colletotrichum zoysiae]